MQKGFLALKQACEKEETTSYDQKEEKHSNLIDLWNSQQNIKYKSFCLVIRWMSAG